MRVKLTVSTTEREQTVNVTPFILEALAQQGIMQGFCHVFVPHTTAAITINEGFDPTVMHDVLTALDRLVPWQNNYTHLENDPSLDGNSAAHIKAVMVGTQTTIAIVDGRLALGQWQKVLFLEFDGPRTRELHLNFYNAR